VRNSNEDSRVVNAETGLFLVADGMGGHAAGEIASREAARAVENWVAANADHAGEPAEMLRAALLDANARVYAAQQENRALAGMGSTLTAILFRDDRYCVAHAGDSRAYLLRAGVLEQLTNDHSLVWHLYQNGLLLKSDLAKHPQKNLITRSIGSHPQVDVDVLEGDSRPGDVFLLCSDGLTDRVAEEAIREALDNPRKSPQEMADWLVDAANEGGGPDNITVVVIRLASGAKSA
jgi:protein phosphatase